MKSQENPFKIIKDENDVNHFSSICQYLVHLEQVFFSNLPNTCIISFSFLNGERGRDFLLYLTNSLEEDITCMSPRIRNLLESCIPLKSLSPLRQEMDCKKIVSRFRVKFLNMLLHTQTCYLTLHATM